MAGKAVKERRLRERAFRALEGVGSPGLGEWEEYTGKAFHLRRRLTLEEAEPIGPAVDVRGTPEQMRRFEAMRLVLPPGMAEQLGSN